MTAPTRPDELRFAIELIDACRKVVGEYGKWQTMDSAPRDGTPILLLIERTDGTRRSVEVGRYEADHSKKPRPYWVRLTSEYVAEMRSNQPLAWMALPSTELAAQLRELRLGLDAVRATLANLPGATHERECTCDYCIDSARQLAAALAGKA